MKLKRIEAIKILLNIHNSMEELNKLALKKNIDMDIEDFFNQLKAMDEFKNEKFIIEKLKEEFIIYNEGKKRNNLRFGIVNEQGLIKKIAKSTHSLALRNKPISFDKIK